VATNTDELLLQLTKRPNGVDFYGINEVEVSGAAVSLPIATRTDGSPSQLDAQHSILLAVDQDTSTSWASGPESQVQIMLPLESGTTVSQVQFHWNCQTLTNLLRLGAASQYFIFARDQNSGQLVQIPFTSGGRSAAGLETAVFGTSQSSSPVTTDQILILLTVRESGVDSYSLKEVSLQNGSLAVPMRLPTAMSTLSWGTTYSVVRAFDGDLQTGWASDTQGSVTAVDVLGSNMKFTGLKVINFGTKAKRECFPFAVIAPVLSSANPLPFRNVLVQDCLFTQPATNNSDGLTTVIVIGYESASLQNASIRNCSVTAVQEQFFYSHAFVGKLIENCFADDCQVGIYFEPDPSGAGLDSVGQVTVRSNVFQNVERGISLDFHPGAVFDSLICQGNELVLAGTDSRGWGFGACDVCSAGPSGTITNVTALNNIVRYADWAPRPAALEIGFLYSDIHHAVYGNNLVALGTADPLRVRQDPAGSIPSPTVNEDCDHPGLVQPGPSSYAPSVNLLQPGYRRAWYNNRGLSGMLLPVRYSFWGVDGLAAQQQWPQ
jgi:hypothetical protein